MNPKTLRWLHLLAFVVPFTVFTVLLLIPHPMPESLSDSMDLDLRFLVNKAAHLSGFAYLTAVGFFYPRRKLARWGMMALMAFHGVATEIGQTYVPNRSGSVRDVLIDWLGVAFGMLIVLLLRRKTWRYFAP